MIPANKMNAWPGVLERYRSTMTSWLSPETPIVTLQEGNTPLIPAPRLAQEAGGGFDLYLKFEGLNPTCSFKDRGMTLAVSKARERGAEVVICASTGNTSASAAAYAAQAKMKCVVLLPHGKIALGKLAQALMYGATTIAVEGNFDAALRLVRELGQTGKVEVVNSINPARIEGQKTAAFEICDQLGRPPDFHFLPVGNAGNITAYWKGYREYFAAKKCDRLPRMFGFQAAGAAPIVLGKPVDDPQTVATAIRIGNPASWQGASQALKDSNGFIDKVTDEEILAAYNLIARTDGIFVEPASAACLAGLIQRVRAGAIPAGSVIAATMTGHGLKDPDTALKAAGSEPILVPPTKEAVMKVIGL
jgi:threonine synthase